MMMLLNHWGSGGFHLFHGLGLIINLLIFGVISGLIILLVIRNTGKKVKGDEAIEILNKRLASGEITREQYDEIKAKIS
jgi:uncharacterized membrane protein